MHEHRVLMESGRTLYVGGGVKWQSGVAQPSEFMQRLVVRADARFVSRTGGVDVDEERRHYIPSAAAWAFDCSNEFVAGDLRHTNVLESSR